MKSISIMDDLNNKPTDKNIDVLAIDGIDVDWLFKMTKLPSFDEKLAADLIGKFPGGPVGNFACVASKLGLNVAFMCNLGNDEGGKLLLRDFQENNVDISYITIDEKINTPFVVVIVDPTGEKAVIIPGFPEITDANVSYEAIARAKFVYMFAENTQRFHKIAKFAKKSGTKVMMDIEPTGKVSGNGIYDLLNLCDIASFNERGFESTINKSFSIETARELLDFGPEIVLVTRGRKGVIAIDQNEVVETPGYQVEVKDTTGAGDTFNAAFLSSTIRGSSLKQSVQFGNAAAALLIQTIGTRTKIPTVQDINEFIFNKPIKN